MSPRRVKIVVVVGIVVALLIALIAIGSSAKRDSGSSSTSSSQPSAPSTETATDSPATVAPSETPLPTESPAAPAASGTAGALLAALATDNSPESHTGYNRDLFTLWIDADGDGCNTRAEVLMTESGVSTSHTGTCTISTGKWFSAYDGVWMTVASQLDIDHFVPLSEAWKSGAFRWDSNTRKSFANDLAYSASLIAVSASTNRSKGDQDPAAWMPPNSGFACTYVATWVAVKYRWSLTVDSSERSAISRVLGGCGNLKVATPAKASVANGPAVVAGGTGGGTSSGTTSGATTGGNGSGDGKTDPNYGTCKAAKAAGRGPYIKGIDPEYAFYRDGDKDGTVCE